LQLYFFFKAVQDRCMEVRLLAASTLALMIFNGGTHILPMSIAAIGCVRWCRRSRAATGVRSRSRSRSASRECLRGAETAARRRVRQR
jgi:hypothetical protein